MDTKLRDSDQFLKDYGLAFISINKVETLLDFFLLKKGKLALLPEDIKDKLLEGATLGRKFSLAKNLIKDSKLKKKIGNLIEKRKLIAHKNLNIHYNLNGEANEFSFKGKQLIKENFLPKLVMLAVESAEELIKELEEH